MSGPFVLFGTGHLSIITLTLVIPLALAWVSRSRGSCRITRTICWTFLALLVAARTLWFILLSEFTIETMLPMQLCDWTTVVVMITLIHPNRWTYELSYFWGLGGTLQALLTPDLTYDFPDPQFIVFFALHGGVIASLVYLTFGMGMRPVPMSIVRVLAWSFLYLVLALASNALLGTNFGYLSAKPAQPSLLDLMAPWPYYIAELAFTAIISSLICYAPFFVVDFLQRYTNPPTSSRT